jgi:glutathione S-transferase
MKLYDDKETAINPRRVRIFLAEKNINIPTEQVGVLAGESKGEAYRRVAPNGLVPALVLDDGTVISESVAICRYFEELHPDPPLMGNSALEKANIDMWQRRIEFELFQPISHFVRHSFPMLEVVESPQVSQWAEVNRIRALARLAALDTELGSNAYIAGPRYSIADITALCAVDFALFAGLSIEGLANLLRWHALVSDRPSAKA